MYGEESVRRLCLMCLLILILSLNIFATLPKVLVKRFSEDTRHKVESASILSSQSYSYLNGDFPELLPLPHPHTLPQAALTIEPSRHYQMNGSEAAAEWASALPSGHGILHLGPNHDRPFTISMFHQIRCLDVIRRAILASPDSSDLGLDPSKIDGGKLTEEDASECIGYIRQMVLCASDTTLEPQSIRALEEDGVTAVDGYDVTHVCRDWTAVYEMAEQNFVHWGTKGTAVAHQAS